MVKGIYIAASNQHVGKTTCTLGLVAALKNKSINVGYCKPLGQRYVHHNGKRVDKDAAVFAKLMNFELAPELHSPVIMGGGDSVRYIENPDDYNARIEKALVHAATTLDQQHELVVYEGTGHPGVGSVFDFSNADVAKKLGLGVILIVEGGIGNTIDRLSLCKNYFDAVGVNVVGVIINKVIPNKMEKVRKYLKLYLDRHNIEILGMIPFAEELVYPLVTTIVKEIKGEVLVAAKNLDTLVQHVMAGSLVDLEDVNVLKRSLLVVSARRLTAAMSKLRRFWDEKKVEPNLVGVVVTGPAMISNDWKNYLKNHNISLIHTNYDPYETVIKIDNLHVKINTKTPQKIEKAIELFERHVNVSRIYELMGIRL
ncbi:MAG: AAA family ATPase [Chitinophagales bacterium]